MNTPRVPARVKLAKQRRIVPRSRVNVAHPEAAPYQPVLVNDRVTSAARRGTY